MRFVNKSIQRFTIGASIFVAIFLVLASSTSLLFSTAAFSSATHEPAILFVENFGSGTVSVIKGERVVATIKVGKGPTDQISYANETNTLWVTNSLSHTVSVINVTTDKIVTTLMGFRDPIAVEYGLWPYIPPEAIQDLCLEYIADNATHTVYVYNGTNYDLLATISVGENPGFIGYSPASGFIYVSNSGGQSVSVINWTANKVVDTINIPGSNPSGIAYDPANKEIYVAGGSSGDVYAINSKNEIVKTITGFDDPFSLAYNPVNKEMYFTDKLAGDVVMLNSANDVVGLVPGVGTPTGIAYDSNHKLIYVSDSVAARIYPISGSTLGVPINVGTTPEGEIST